MLSCVHVKASFIYVSVLVIHKHTTLYYIFPYNTVHYMLWQKNHPQSERN